MEDSRREFSGDGYHVSWSHQSPIRAWFGITAGTAPGGGPVSPGNGHGLITVDGRHSLEPLQLLVDYEEDTRKEVEARLGPRARMLNPVVGTVFPNLSPIRATTHSFRVRHPKGPNSIEIWSWAFTDKAAPREVKEAFRVTAIRAFGAPGVFEQDDWTTGRSAGRPAWGWSRGARCLTTGWVWPKRATTRTTRP